MRTFNAGRIAAVAALALPLTIAGVGHPGAASAGSPDGWGYALVDTAGLPSYPCDFRPDLSRQAVSSGIPATACALGHAQYRVTFPGIGPRPGVAHVTAVTHTDRWCQVATTNSIDADRFVDVQCYGPGGRPEPGAFSVVFSTSSGPSAGDGFYAYLRSDEQGTILSDYNSTGSHNTVSKGPAPVGEYRVVLSGLVTGGPPDGNIQVTAETADLSRRCKVTDWSYQGQGGNQMITVGCFDQQNKSADSGFHLTFQSKRKIYGGHGAIGTLNFGYDWLPVTTIPSGFNSRYGINQVKNDPPGRYTLTLPLVGIGRPHAQVTAYGGGPAHCALKPGMTIDGGTAVVGANCFTGTGDPVDSGSFITYTSDV
nr:hypothetical protein [Micromonospora sp. DSM 115978]